MTRRGVCDHLNSAEKKRLRAAIRAGTATGILTKTFNITRRSLGVHRAKEAGTYDPKARNCLHDDRLHLAVPKPCLVERCFNEAVIGKFCERHSQPHFHGQDRAALMAGRVSKVRLKEETRGHL